MTRRNERLRPALSALVGLGLSCPGPSARATNNYTYKPGEYVTIANGRSPDGRYSLAAHGEGDLGLDHFHIFLMAEPGHRKVGPLEEIGDVLDTGADAFRARWAPDSRHVAVLYRTDRHILALRVCRIEHGRAWPVTGPLPVAAVVARLGPSARAAFARPEASSRFFTLTWQGPTRFLLDEQDEYLTDRPALARGLGRFARAEPVSTDGSDRRTLVEFSARAVCALTSADRWRLVRLRPGP